MITNKKNRVALDFKIFIGSLDIINVYFVMGCLGDNKLELEIQAVKIIFSFAWHFLSIN